MHRTIAMTHTLPANIQRFERNGKIILINPEVPAWIVTNSTGELITTLFDGINSDAEVVDIATEGLGEQFRQQVSQFVSHIIASNIFSTKPIGQPHRQLLSMVHLSLSNHCNLRCRYCYAAQRHESSGKPLTFDEYCSLIDNLRAINPEVGFTITGGEPLLSPIVLDIARKIKERGNYAMLLTNGTLLSNTLCLQLKGLIDQVTISVDATTPQKHALTRGDNLNAVERAIAMLDSHNIPCSISMTVTSLNIDEVEPMARKYGARLSFAPLFPVSDQANSLAITGDQYYNALKAAAGVNPLAYCETSLDAAMKSPCLKCAIAEGEISIAPNGDVYPCQLLHNPEFLCGNIRSTPIAQIYADSAAAKRCRALTVDNLDKCNRCAIKYICGGACRARSFYESGDITNVGPFCSYELNAYLDGIARIYSANAIAQHTATPHNDCNTIDWSVTSDTENKSEKIP